MDNKTVEIQKNAWEIIQTPEYWYRRHYNLCPSDPRFLDAEKEEILTDFWCYVLYERMLKLRNEGVEQEDISLDSLVLEDVFEEECRKAREEAKRQAQPPETLIDIRG
jgi:hypothetical protein